MSQQESMHSICTDTTQPLQLPLYMVLWVCTVYNVMYFLKDAGFIVST